MIETEASGQKVYSEPSPMLGYGNFSSFVVPTVNDDEPHGYSINSMWYKLGPPNRLFICIANPEGAAEWSEISLTDHRSHRAIFDHYGDTATTADIVPEILHTGVIPAYTFYTDGDEVRITYRGTYAANTNSKDITLVFGSDEYFSFTTTKNGGAWRIEVEAMRTASDTLDITVTYHDTSESVVNYAEFAAQDFTLPEDWHFQALAATAAGDLILHTDKAILIPAAPVGAVTEAVEFLADGLTFGSVAVEFTA